MPGGSSFSTVCDAAVTCASAVRILTPFWKKDLDHAITAERLRLDMLDIADLGAQGPLIIVDHAARHVARQQPVIGPDHADNRHVDVRKNVGWSPQRREDPEYRYQERNTMNV